MVKKKRFRLFDSSRLKTYRFKFMKGKDRKKFFRTVFIYILVGLLLIFIFKKNLILIISLIFFTILGIITINLSKMVPKVNIETFHSASLLIGYVWGPIYSIPFGWIAGFLGYVSISKFKNTVFANNFLMGTMGLVAYLLKITFDLNFHTTFIITYIIRIFTGLLVFPMVGSDPLSTFSHATVDSTFNILITRHLMFFFYNIIISLEGI